MIKLLFIIFLSPALCFAQEQRGLRVINGQLKLINFTTGDTTNVGGENLPVTTAAIATALGYTPVTPTELATKANIVTVADAGTVTQLTSKATAVTLNKIAGRITMNGAALAAAAEVTFTVNNSFVAANDIPHVAIQSVGTAGSYLVSVGSVSAGAFTVTVSNVSTASLSQAIVLNFIILKVQ